MLRKVAKTSTKKTISLQVRNYIKYYNFSLTENRKKRTFFVVSKKKSVNYKILLLSVIYKNVKNGQKNGQKNVRFAKVTLFLVKKHACD